MADGNHATMGYLFSSKRAVDPLGAWRLSATQTLGFSTSGLCVIPALGVPA
jgi:hypothetical protein